jgi:hypothetical protein
MCLGGSAKTFSSGRLLMSSTMAQSPLSRESRVDENLLAMELLKLLLLMDD